MKRVISLILSVSLICVLLLSADLYAFSQEDNTPPQIDFSTLSVTLPEGKSAVTAGDTVTISLKLTDESDFDGIYFLYYSPVSQETGDGYAAVYDAETEYAVCQIPITKRTESGEWKLYAIGAVDIYENESGAFNSELVSQDEAPEDFPCIDLSAGSFTVEGTIDDTDAPEIDLSTLKLVLPSGKSAVTAGDSVTVSLRVTDYSDISNVTVYYYPETNKNSVPNSLSYNGSSGLYEGKIQIKANTESGYWKIDRIYLNDSLNNSTTIFSSEIYDVEDSADFSACNFRVTRSITGAYVSAVPDYQYTGKAITPHPFISENGYTLAESQDYSLAYKNNVNAGKASLIISGIGNYTGSITKYFNITAPPVKKVTKPKATKITKLVKGKKKFTVKWKKISAVTGYQIQYSTSKKFKKAKKKTVKGAKKTKLTVKKLKAKKKYYLRIRTYKKVGKKTYYSKWSKVKAVKTK